MFCKTTAARDSDSSYASEQSKSETLWKSWTIPAVIRTFMTTKIKIATSTGVWEKLILTFMDGEIEGFKTSVTEVTADIVKNNKRTEWRLKVWLGCCHLQINTNGRGAASCG